MSLSIQLPAILEERLVIFCQAHGITEDQAIQRALEQLLSENGSLAPYDIGVEGFGADHTHSGDIAINSRRILRERFRGPVTR